MSVTRCPEVTLMADEATHEAAAENASWMDKHKAMILLMCGCWWCEDCGDLRALRTCSGHMRDYARYGAKA